MKCTFFFSMNWPKNIQCYNNSNIWWYDRKGGKQSICNEFNGNFTFRFFQLLISNQTWEPIKCYILYHCCNDIMLLILFNYYLGVCILPCIRCLFDVIEFDSFVVSWMYMWVCSCVYFNLIWIYHSKVVVRKGFK